MRNVLLFFLLCGSTDGQETRENRKISFFYIWHVFFYFFGYCVRILQMILRFFNDSFLGCAGFACSLQRIENLELKFLLEIPIVVGGRVRKHIFRALYICRSLI